MNEGLSLVVPVQVQALSISPQDATSNAFVLAPMADFSQLPYVIDGVQNNRGPYINAQVNQRGNPFGTELGLPAGIHLHWQLPAGLTRGQQQPDGSLVYPCVPNRWLVTRIHVTNPGTAYESVSTKSWVVESDRLNTASVAAAGIHQPTVPAEPDGINPCYRYIGQTFDASSWNENTMAERFPNLTAVGYGEASFAAYYPNCSTVFGFQDFLYDITYTTGDTLSYQVSGWYSDSQNDPLASGITGSDNLFGWSFSNPSGNTVNNTFCSGSIDNVLWGTSTPALSSSASPLSVAVAASSQEAISVLLANQLNGDPQLAEQIINALQFGVLAQAGDTSNSAQQLSELVHAAGFASFDGGRIWQVRKRTQPGQNQDYEGEVTLPEPLADDLNTLNLQQTELNELNEKLASKRSQLFSDWYKYLLIEYETHYTPDNVKRRGQEVRDYLLNEAQEISALENQVSSSGALQQSITELAAFITSSIDDVYELISDATAPRYWRANNPFLLFQGNDVVPVDRTGNGLVNCRISDQLVYYVELNAQTAGTNFPFAVQNTVPIYTNQSSSAPWSVIDQLVNDGVLLLPSQQSYLAKQFCEYASRYMETLNQSTVTNQLVDQLEAFMNKVVNADENYLTQQNVRATAPDQLQQSSYSGNPWLPIMVHYDVEMQPMQNLMESGVYAADFILNNFTRSSNGVDYDTNAVPSGITQTITGSLLLTSDSKVDLQQGIRNYIEQTGNTDTALLDLLATIADVPLMAQELSGFGESLLMRQQSLQMRVDDPLANPFDRDFVLTIRNAVGNAADYSPEINHSYNPIRSGTLHIQKLRIVDAFGRFRDIETPANTYVASSYKPQNGLQLPAGTALLPPRISQPTRLLFRWLAADTDAMETNTHPASSPIIGWVLPDYADQSIAIFSADGTPLGELALSASADSVLWFSAPGGLHPVGTSLAAVFENQLPWLRNFANSMSRSSTADFAAFLVSLRTAAQTVMPGVSSGINGVLAGQPLALVRATLSLDLMGEPAASESWDAFAASLVPGSERYSGAFQQVKVPVQLGAPGNYRDGLLGYWLQQNTAVDFNAFYAPGSGIREPEVSTLTLTSNLRTQTVMMLVDPNGVVSASSGILPVKQISIPADQFEAGLNQLSFTMLTAPVLTGSNTTDIRIPMPKTTGGFWSWVSADADGNWQSQNFGDTVQNTSSATLDYTPQQILEGWLRLRRTDA